MLMVDRHHATAADGTIYNYVEISRSWKKVCEDLPSNNYLAWPGYRTKAFYGRALGGHGPLCVQLWKGWCQRTGGGNDKAGGSFPGGVGAEVCVYQYGLAKYGGGLYPYLKKPFRLKFQLQPPGGDPGIFFTASTKADSYWLGCWMTHNDYKDKYKPKHPNHPVDPARYILKYWIDGAPQPDWV